MDYHELSTKHNINYRKSGLTLAVILAAFYAILLLRGKNYYALPVVAGLLTALAIIQARALYSIIDMFIKIGNLMHRFTNPLVFALIYIFGVLPTTFFLKITSKDILRLRYEKRSPSYWLKRSETTDVASSFKQQY